MCPSDNTHLYQLNSKALQELNKTMFTPDQMANWASEVKLEAWEEKVLKNYLEGDRIVEIPASRKKRFVILKWLVRQFEPEVNYLERTINEIIQRHHPKCATLRREMIDYRLMLRENGIYWRSPEAIG